MLKRIVLLLFLIFALKAAGQEAKASGSTEKPLPAEQTAKFEVPAVQPSAVEMSKTPWYSHFFAAGSLQTFMSVSRLKNYTQPKPGYRLAGGYTFLHSGQHSIPLYFETGHSVISGRNPLIQTFDIVPLTVNVAYEYSPVKYFSAGTFLGTGFYFSSIRHYPTVLGILTNNLEKTSGAGGVFNLGIVLGGNIFERAIEFRAAFSCDIILEKPQAVPLPSFQLGLRMYPYALYSYARKKQTAEVIIKEVPVHSTVVVKEEVPELPQFASIFVYFEPETAKLDVNAKAEIKKAAEILKANDEVFIVFEGSTAPFGSQAGRIKLENSRILAVSEYLQKNCGIAAERIIYTEPFKNQDAKKEAKAHEEHYTQFRYVKLRFVRLQYNSDEGENIYKLKNTENPQ